MRDARATRANVETRVVVIFASAPSRATSRRSSLSPQPRPNHPRHRVGSTGGGLVSPTASMTLSAIAAKGGLVPVPSSPRVDGGGNPRTPPAIVRFGARVQGVSSRPSTRTSATPRRFPFLPEYETPRVLPPRESARTWSRPPTRWWRRRRRTSGVREPNARAAHTTHDASERGGEHAARHRGGARHPRADAVLRADDAERADAERVRPIHPLVRLANPERRLEPRPPRRRAAEARRADEEILNLLRRTRASTAARGGCRGRFRRRRR